MSDLLWKLDQVSLAGSDAGRSGWRLDGVSLHIQPGVTAIIGYSGAGKTSLLNLLTGFERPDRGTCAATLPKLPERLPLYWVPQNGALWPHLTTAEHLQAVTPENRNPDRVDEVLSAFDLDHRRDALPETLSQGERSRLALTRAIASEAAVLVLDEPLSHVDPARCGRYWGALRRFTAESQTSLVFATHVAETVLNEATHAVCLQSGRVVWVGAVSELYHRPPTAELATFLGPANWFGDHGTNGWLAETAAQTRRNAALCIRPEQLSVVPTQSSPLVVEASRFSGSHAEVELRDDRSGERRALFHRPAAPLRVGDRVLLRILSLLLVIVFLAGCDKEQAEPKLEVKDVQFWTDLAEGNRIAAPRSVTWGPGPELYVLDTAGRVIVFDGTGKRIREWHMPAYDVGRPEGVCVFKDGRVVVTDTHYHRVVVFDKQGKVLELRGGHGTEPGQFIYPVGLTQDPDENYYVCEYGSNDRVQKFSADGKFLLQFGGFGTEPGKFQRPSGITWLDGKLYVADAINNRIQVFSDKGEFLEILVPRDTGEDSPGVLYPYDVNKTPDGNLLVIEYGGGRLSKFDVKGKLLGRYGTTGRGEGEFSTPWGLAVSSDGLVAVADTGNRRIVRLRP